MCILTNLLQNAGLSGAAGQVDAVVLGKFLELFELHLGNVRDFHGLLGDGRDDLRLVLAGGIDAHIVSQLVELLLVHLAEEVGAQMAGDGVSVRESLEIAAFQQRGIFLGVVHKDVRMRRRGAHNAIIGQTFNQSEVHSVLPPVR